MYKILFNKKITKPIQLSNSVVYVGYKSYEVNETVIFLPKRELISTYEIGNDWTKYKSEKSPTGIGYLQYNNLSLYKLISDSDDEQLFTICGYNQNIQYFIYYPFVESYKMRDNMTSFSLKFTYWDYRVNVISK